MQESSEYVKDFLADIWDDCSRVTVVKFIVNDEGRNGVGSFEVKEWVNTRKLTVVRAARVWSVKERYSSKIKPRLWVE